MRLSISIFHCVYLSVRGREDLAKTKKIKSICGHISSITVYLSIISSWTIVIAIISVIANIIVIVLHRWAKTKNVNHKRHPFV